MLDVYKTDDFSSWAYWGATSKS